MHAEVLPGCVGQEPSPPLTGHTLCGWTTCPCGTDAQMFRPDLLTDFGIERI